MTIDYIKIAKAKICLDLGRYLIEKGDIETALMQLRETIKLEENPEAYYLMGKAYFSKKDVKEAGNYFSKAIKLLENMK